MGEKLTDKDRELLDKLWVRTGGKSWEPPDPNFPFFERAIAAGYLKRVDGICGFERLKDAMVAWTEAGRAALSKAEGRSLSSASGQEGGDHG